MNQMNNRVSEVLILLTEGSVVLKDPFDMCSLLLNTKKYFFDIFILFRFLSVLRAAYDKEVPFTLIQILSILI